VPSNLDAIYGRIGELLREQAPEGWRELVAGVEYAAGFEKIFATARTEAGEPTALAFDFDELEAAFRAMHHVTAHPEGRSWCAARLTLRRGQGFEVQLTYGEDGRCSTPLAA
jgi:hypothetical protein